MGFILLLHLVLVAAAARAPAGHAWGVEGHYMVCKIAESYLTSQASVAVKGLLPESAGGELAKTCSWPDTVRRQIPWPTPGETASLTMPGTATARTERKTCAWSGRSTTTPPRCKTRQAHVWDDKVIGTDMNRLYSDDLSTMIGAIKGSLTKEWSSEQKEWQACPTRTRTCADKFAEESAELSCPAYVGAGQGSNLEDEYFFKARPVVEKRIAQGGVRLAAILNQIFSGNSNNRLQSI